MKKQEFLDELKGYLAVLEDEEQEDILGEYSQHIQMKIEKGMSEDEAIRDFGSLQELAAEILEAYHVKPGYGRAGTGRAFPRLFWKRADRRGAEEGGEEEKRRLVGWIGMIGKGLRGAWAWLLRAVKALGRKLVWLIALPLCLGKQVWESVKGREKAGQKDEEEAQLNLAGEEEPFFSGDGEKNQKAEKNWKAERSRKAGRGKCARCAGRRLASWIQGIIRWSLRCVIWWCRLGWNFCVVLAAAGAAFCGLVCLYFLGLLSVLWCQGYPFLGAVLGCFGAVLCFVSLSVLGCTFFWVKPKKESEGGESRKPDKGGEEAFRQGKQDGLEIGAGR